MRCAFCFLESCCILTLFSFQPIYRQWCEKNQFISMLPKDVQARKVAIRDAAEKHKQSTMDPHVEKKPSIKQTVPYSSALFREVAVEWLVCTDQPIDALEHPSFRQMIEIASRASSVTGVDIPNRKATRAHIIARFKKSLSDLSEQLNVRSLNIVTPTRITHRQ
ncbi:hypothetical protein F5880DRAFT_1472177 [Lentinula raphanica]|nr:hypothetical protein F5880DRAFT_1472177 [Lentinula raphanica]